MAQHGGARALGDRPHRGRVGRPVVDDDHPEAVRRASRGVATVRGLLADLPCTAQRPGPLRGAVVGVPAERGEEAGEAVGAVLHRDHHGHVRRRRHGVGGLGHRVRDPGVEQAAGERGGRRVGDGEPALDQPGGRGGRQVQHPRRRPAEQHRAVVEHAGAALQHDGRAVRDGGAVGPGAHPAHARPPRPERRVAISVTASLPSHDGESPFPRRRVPVPTTARPHIRPSTIAYRERPEEADCGGGPTRRARVRPPLARRGAARRHRRARRPGRLTERPHAAALTGGGVAAHRRAGVRTLARPRRRRPVPLEPHRPRAADRRVPVEHGRQPRLARHRPPAGRARARRHLAAGRPRRARRTALAQAHPQRPRPAQDPHPGGRAAVPDRVRAGRHGVHRRHLDRRGRVPGIRPHPRGAARRHVPRRVRDGRPRRRDDHGRAATGPPARLRLPRRPRHARPRPWPRLAPLAAAAAPDRRARRARRRGACRPTRCCW